MIPTNLTLPFPLDPTGRVVLTVMRARDIDGSVAAVNLTGVKAYYHGSQGWQEREPKGAPSWRMLHGDPTDGYAGDPETRAVADGLDPDQHVLVRVALAVKPEQSGEYLDEPVIIPANELVHVQKVINN